MTLRIGLLGAAKIAPAALLRPARTLPDVEILAIASRDPRRAHALARRYRIPRVYRTYEEVIGDPAIDAVYIPLPNALHGVWTRRALHAGKHVLCEKPLTANADEAEAVAAAAHKAGRCVLEAFAYRYHPMADRLRSMIAGGDIGNVRRIEADFLVPLLRRGDIRWRAELAGGSLMDAGCYPISLVRWLAGAEPDVVAARAVLASPDVDRTMTAELRFPNGTTARIRSSLLSRHVFRSVARVVGSAGTALVFNPYHPSYGNLLFIAGQRGRRVEMVRGDNVYRAQLRAFARIIAGEAVNRTAPEDSIGTMLTIDAIYRAAGMRPRNGVAYEDKTSR
ncbi:MAG: oxidoreductase [Dehalococcoidia bacterium]|nr:MAG: oxidoreductase [Dehalococcoidia bacterium]